MTQRRAELERQLAECQHQRELLPPGKGFANERVLIATRIDFIEQRLAQMDYDARFMPLREHGTVEREVSLAKALAAIGTTVCVVVLLLMYGMGVL